jgi:hypothetical protein
LPEAEEEGRRRSDTCERCLEGFHRAELRGKTFRAPKPNTSQCRAPDWFIRERAA